MPPQRRIYGQQAGELPTYACQGYEAKRCLLEGSPKASDLDVPARATAAGKPATLARPPSSGLAEVIASTHQSASAPEAATTSEALLRYGGPSERQTPLAAPLVEADAGHEEQQRHPLWPAADERPEDTASSKAMRVDDGQMMSEKPPELNANTTLQDMDDLADKAALWGGVLR